MDLNAYKNFFLSPLKFFMWSPEKAPNKIPVRSIRANNIPLPNKQRPAAKPIPPRKRYNPYHRHSAAQSIRDRRSERLNKAGLNRSLRRNVESIYEDARRALQANPEPRHADLVAVDFMEQLVQDKMVADTRMSMLESVEEARAMVERAKRARVFRSDETLAERQKRRAREKKVQELKEEQEKQRLDALAKKQERERLKKLEEERLRKIMEETREQKFCYGPEAGASRQQDEMNARKKRMEEQARAGNFFTSKLEDQFPHRRPNVRVNGLGSSAHAWRREMSFKRRMSFIRQQHQKRAAQRAQDKPWVPKGRDFHAERLQRNGMFNKDFPKPPPQPQPNIFQKFPRTQPEAYFHRHNFFPQPQPQADFQQRPPPQARHQSPPRPKEPQTPPKPKYQPPPQAPPPQHNINQNAQAPPSPLSPPQSTLAQRYELYEKKWEALRAGKDGDNPIPMIYFGNFPWPALCDVAQVEDVNEQKVTEFIFHADRPGFQGKSRRDRIRKELIYWHSDKFDSKMLDYIAPEHRQVVQEVAGEIARFLIRELHAKN